MAPAHTDAWPHSLMWHTQPAAEWKQGLPIGNGLLAGMILGLATKERTALNHERLWRGQFRSRTIEPVHERLDEIRRLFFEGKVLEASTLTNETLGGAGGMVAGSRPNRVDPYQPAGDLWVQPTHGPVGEYRRQLDLDSAVASVSYVADAVRYRREYFAHSGRPIMAIRLSAQGDKPFDGSIELSRVEDPDCEISSYAAGNALGFTGRFVEGIRFAIEARVFTDGQVSISEADKASARLAASEALILLSIAVDLDDGDPLPACRAQLDDAPANWDDLLAEHVSEHRKLYRRVRLEIGDDNRHIDTAERLERMRAGKSDDGMLALHANFGRYLLISSSRPGGLPANLQGKWNEDIAPPWDCDLHHDINLQMNYWPAEVCGMGELAEPLLDHVERSVPHGRVAAQKLYNCRGIWLPIQTDPWGRCTPESRGWDVWIGAAAWLAQHFWFRYEYSLDEAFLRTRAYPLFKEVAAFYEDYLVTDPRSGYLVPVPSQSPENPFVGGTEPVSLCVAAAMDIELIQDTLSHAIAAAEILDLDAELCEKWRNILAKLAPLQVGRHGQLQEWFEDYEEIEVGHRHLSHLYHLFPGDRFTPEDAPQLTRAARVALERRLSAGGGHSGWSRSWCVCCWARLAEGDLACEHLVRLLLDFATVSLLDLHPPKIFQIDGNFGATAGLCEMLLQSHRGAIRILPALPSSWKSGKVAGLKARGNFTVDIEWTGGKASNVRIVSHAGRPCTIACGQAPRRIVRDGLEVSFERLGDGRIRLATETGGVYELSW